MSKYVGNYKLESHGKEYRIEVWERDGEQDHMIYWDNDSRGIRQIGVADSETHAIELLEWWSTVS